MEGEIINRVAESALEVFDLEDYYPQGTRTFVDIAQWLDDGFLLREKNFRQALKTHDWRAYSGHLVAVGCSTDAILPAWAPMLVASHLVPFARKVVHGPLSGLDQSLYAEVLAQVDYSHFKDKPVMIKGCARKPVPESAYVLAMGYLQPIARSIMYGEACSAVPLFKAAKA